MRTLRRFDVWREGEMVYFVVAGDGFLNNMVRILGARCLAWHRASYAEELSAILASRDRSQAGETAPACGLYLNRVFYTA